jgi:AraC-like DNA-binding protein
MTGRTDPATSSAAVESASATIGPLVELLRRELTQAGIAMPGDEPTSIRAFAHWYLQAVQRLEQYCAGEDEHGGMTRDEVEMLCRCTLSASTLEEAMQLCAQFCRMLHPRAGRTELVSGAAIACFRMDSLRRHTTTASNLVDITGLFAFRQLFQWLAGTELPLLQVSIGPIERHDLLPFLRLFRAPVLAGGDSYAMEFPAEVLRLPVVRNPGEFDAFFEVFPCGVFEDTRRELSQQVAALLSASLRMGETLPTQRDVARALGLPLSTFRRRLAESGTGYRALREECLRAMACNYLERTALPITEVSARLGFSDPGAFRRAFRQWTGTAPTRWRGSIR